MTNIVSDVSSIDRLRHRLIGPCKCMRLLAALWFLSSAAQTIWNWSDRTKILDNYSRWLKIDVTQAPAFDYALASFLLLVDHLVAFGIFVAVWRLTATCMAGHVFSLAASKGLKQIANAAFLSLSADILIRHLVQLVLTWHAPSSGFPLKLALNSIDALHLLIICFIFSLGQMFKTAAEIAEEQAGFV